MTPFNGGWEPVASSMQIVALPFVASVEGLLSGKISVDRLRVTLHRVISREGEGYLQQACNYLGAGGAGKDGAGRVFATDYLMIGKAFAAKKILRTKHHASLDELRKKIEASDEKRPFDEVPRSYLCVPFVTADDRVAAILFADCFSLNFFADDQTVADVVGTCRGFSRFIDSLEANPLPGIRNFPFSDPVAQPASNKPAYVDVHEEVDSIEPPRFVKTKSLNFDVGPEAGARRSD
jgi:hypothetical protein